MQVPLDRFVWIAHSNCCRDSIGVESDRTSHGSSKHEENEMEVSVIIRQTEQHLFHASTAFPEALSSESDTRDGALTSLTERIQNRLCGAECVTLELPATESSHPWLRRAGTWADHPDIDSVEQHIREYRRQIDEDAQQP